jgi:hypothetical protein
MRSECCRVRSVPGGLRRRRLYRGHEYETAPSYDEAEARPNAIPLAVCNSWTQSVLDECNNARRTYTIPDTNPVQHLHQTEHSFSGKACAPRWYRHKLAPTGKRQNSMGSRVLDVMNGLASLGSMSRLTIGRGSMRRPSRYGSTHIVTRVRAYPDLRINRNLECEAPRSRAARATKSKQLTRDGYSASYEGRHCSSGRAKHASKRRAERVRCACAQGCSMAHTKRLDSPLSGSLSLDQALLAAASAPQRSVQSCRKTSKDLCSTASNAHAA